ncbi:MAG: Lacal_2735 family protein [Cyclobacteriaceae bacterium]
MKITDPNIKKKTDHLRILGTLINTHVLKRKSIIIQNHMFNIFKKTSPLQKLYQKHEQLLKDAHQLSKTNRSLSDQKHAEAEEILNKIKAAESK